jgi:hypothetical protein
MTPAEQVRAWVRERVSRDVDEPHGTARERTVRHGAARHGTVRHGTARHGIESHAIERHAIQRRSLERTLHGGLESQDRSAGERSC